MGPLKKPLVRKALIGATATGLCIQPALAAKPSSVEIAVKATFLAKFTSYLDWPPKSLAPGAPIVVCVIGRDPLGPALEQAVSGEVSSGHPLVLRRFATASDVNKCHIAYLGGSVRDVSAALAQASSNAVVTVTDARNADVAGIIHFQIVGSSVKFDIDSYKASRAGIGISSKLLGLARKVRRAN